MSIHRIGVRGDTNTKTSEAFLKRGESIENEKLLLNLSDIKVFSELKGYLAKLLSKGLSVLLVSVYYFIF